MSTTSTVIASVAWDWIPNDEVDLLNHMCIVILTRDEGTLFGASSIQEEGIIEICIWLGHAHPKGVLQYSGVKSVRLFHSADKMQATAWGVIKAMMLCKEVIKS